MGVGRTVYVFRRDFTPGGGTANVANGNFFSHNENGVPLMSAGACALYADAAGGRPFSPVNDYGMATITQGSLSGTYTYDSAMMRYTRAIDPLGDIVAGMNVTLDLAGGAGGPAGMASIVMGPIADPNTFTASFINPDATMAVVSVSADMPITWTPPADSANTYMYFQALQGDGANALVCAVQACQGTLTVPSSLLQAYAPIVGDELVVMVGFVRSTPVPPTTRTPALSFSMGSQVVYQAAIDP
jgi:hypothetical protein